MAELYYEAHIIMDLVCFQAF